MVVPGDNNTHRARGVDARQRHGDARLGQGHRLRTVGEAAARRLGFSTQTTYIVVPEADAHCARAKAAGAEMVLDLVTQDYGGRDYTCRDPEGHVWTFGTDDPCTA